MKLDDIEGECTDGQYLGWILAQSANTTLARTETRAAKGKSRKSQAAFTANAVVFRQLDSSSIALQAACAAGRRFAECHLHFCFTLLNEHVPYLIYRLRDISVDSYSFQQARSPIEGRGHFSGIWKCEGRRKEDVLPVEELRISYRAAEWSYAIVDPATGEFIKNVVGRLDSNLVDSSSRLRGAKRRSKLKR